MLFDGVGDVGDGLDCAAQEFALPLARDDVAVYLPGGEIGCARQFYVDEALVVAEVEVGFAAVAGYEHFAVLIGGHRAGVDVKVGVELQHGYGYASAFEDAP